MNSITIPNSVNFIGSGAFADCTGLNSINISESMTSIGSGAFSGCTGLTSVMISNSITSIGDYAFSGCTGLTSITIPESVTSIGDYSFSACTGLPSIAIPESVTSIGGGAFQSCTGLSYVAIEGNSSIGSSAFYGAKNLITLILHGNSINSRAFAHCEELTDVYNYGNGNNLGSGIMTNAFEGSYIEYATLHVPSDLHTEAQSTIPWKNFGTIVDCQNQIWTITYIINGETYKKYVIEEGASITPEAEPTKEGYTFSGWSNLPETMPAGDVTVTGNFIINQYTITYMISDEVFYTETLDYGSKIVPPVAPEKEGNDFAWDEIPETMPAHNVIIVGTYTVGIAAVDEDNKDFIIYSLDGKKLNKLQRGVNVIRFADGTKKKILVK